MLYIYMVTCDINIPQMLAYIPYMDPMGYVKLVMLLNLTEIINCLELIYDIDGYYCINVYYIFIVY